MRKRLASALLAALSILTGLLLAAPADAQIVPTLSISSHVCRGYYANVTGSSFPDGTYTLASTSGALTPSMVQAVNGQFSAQLKLPIDAPDSFTITATDHTSEVIASLSVSISAPYLYKADNQVTIAPGAQLPVGELIGAGCFRPNETIVLSGSAGVNAGKQTTASSGGWFYFQVHYSPSDQPTDSATVTATGVSSGMPADLTVSIPGTTLAAGQSLAGDRLSAQLTSTSGSYTFVPALCAAPIIGLYAAPPVVTWSARAFDPATGPGPSGCALSLQADGNVVLRSPGGQLLWTTGTTGSGSDNRLVMQDNGALQLLSSSGSLLWSSALAPSYITIASSRVRTAVYVNGLVQQRAPLAELVRGAGRTAFLQRHLAGGWQNVLSRVTDQQGRLAVGFIQSTVFQYRWVLVAAQNARAAISGSTFR
jgi:hypothetical protein